MSQFKEKLYEEFGANSYKLMGVPGNRVQEVLAQSTVKTFTRNLEPLGTLVGQPLCGSA
jgi:hypothetical protein